MRNCRKVGPGHNDVRVETGLAVDVEREIAERNGSGPYHLDDDQLRYRDRQPATGKGGAKRGAPRTRLWGVPEVD